MLGSAVRRGFTFVLLAPLVTQSADLSHNLAARSMQLSVLGDRLFREARFEESETAYAEALDLDQRNVRAHLGMGKIAALLSEPERAARHVSAAYQLAPRDPTRFWRWPT
jgi:Flp pilus assembly protein TadD